MEQFQSPIERLNVRLESILPLVEQAGWDRDIPPVTASLRLAIMAIGAKNIMGGEIPMDKPLALKILEQANDEQIAFALRAALR